MSLSITLATARRVLSQLRHDHRTVALLLIFPTVLMTILRYVFDREEAFDRIAPALLGIFPFTVMFLVTSVATLRERRGGTLERLMTMPMGRGDFFDYFTQFFTREGIRRITRLADNPFGFCFSRHAVPRFNAIIHRFETVA